MACTIDRQSLAVGLISGATIALLLKLWLDRDNDKQQKELGYVDGVDGLIGNTPLMRIKSLSEATGCTILVSFFTLFLLFICLMINKM